MPMRTCIGGCDCLRCDDFLTLFLPSCAGGPLQVKSRDIRVECVTGTSEMYKSEFETRPVEENDYVYRCSWLLFADRCEVRWVSPDGTDYARLQIFDSGSMEVALFATDDTSGLEECGLPSGWNAAQVFLGSTGQPSAEDWFCNQIPVTITGTTLGNQWELTLLT